MTQQDIQLLIIDILATLQKDGLIATDVEINLDTSLYGKNGILASIHVITAVIDIENALSEKTNKRIALTDPKMFSRGNSPFQSVENLAQFTYEKLSNA